MMISYFHLLLFIVSSGQTVLDDYSPDLLRLVGLCMGPLRLEIEDFLNTVLGEDVVVPTDSFLEA